MINSRDIKELHPTVAGKAYTFVERCRQAGIDLLVTSTYRDKQYGSRVALRLRTLASCRTSQIITQ